ncbi:MAG: hypothetical protein M3Y84_02515 [Acidobacteriota bacterium]|nr:hypothetical protein [Acidobacteriota bacterium]
MPRSRTQPKVINPIQNRLLRQNFLRVVNNLCPEAFQSLREYEIELIGKNLQILHPTVLTRDFPTVETAKLAPLLAGSASYWAISFGVEGTWIEDEVRGVLDTWFRQPTLRLSRPDFLPLLIVSQNDFKETTLTFSLPIPHAIGFERPFFSWEVLETHLRDQVSVSFEQALRQLKAEAIQYGVLREEKKLDYESPTFQALALYLFRRMSTQEIGQQPGLFGERTTIWRWIKEASRAVNLSEVVARRRSTRRGAVHRALRKSDQ